ncbi:MAG: putative Transposable element Tc3 transposase [Streblomastix strix]|uniref:Putative Transposable element Tc3 transposase n=1 Tax=Streblomastix strix TaxID=222440 RepID=A0A5J4WR69_9EUKA|nr:MAG: putative Transposable element Tc3 transposase [Streblomastix strix]
MVRGVAFSEELKQEMFELRDKKRLSIKQISILKKKPYKSVWNIITKHDKKKMNKKRGRPEKTSERDKRRIARYTKKNRRISHRRIADALDIDISPTTTLRVLHQKGFKSIRLRRRPFLTVQHINARIRFASDYLCNELLSLIPIVFTDEKKFRYDGPDGWASYWFHVTDKPGIAQMSKDYGKYKGVMVHMALSNYGILNVSRVSGKMNADQWADIVSDHVIPECNVAHGDSYLYQRDNASVHKRKDVVELFEDEGVKFLDWPVLSPDLNPVENVWALLVRKVYKNGRTFTNDSDLWQVIKTESARITALQILPFVNSFRSRLCKVLLRQGKYVQ